MNNRQNYQSLVDKYNNGTRVIKKLGTIGMVMQISIIMLANGWKHTGLSYHEIATPILFSVSIYFLVKDFITLLRIEENMAQMILKGVELEVKDGSGEKFFHHMLQSFNFTNTLIQRSLINALALGCLGYFMLDFVKDVFPSVHIGRWVLGLFAWIPGVIACKLYYDSLKDLDEAKSKVFAK